MKTLIPVLMIAAALLAACGGKSESAAAEPVAPAPEVVVAEGHLVPDQGLYLTFLASGRVAEIPVAQGDRVSEGQVLARLGDSEQAAAALAGAKLNLESAQQAYDALARTAGLSRAQAWQAYMDAQQARAAAQLAWDRLDLNNIQDDIEEAQAEVIDRQKDVEDAQADLDSYADLDEDNATRRSYEDALRQARTDYDTAVARVEALTRQRDSIRAGLDAALAAEAEAQRAYENAQEGPDVERLALAQLNLDAALAQVAAAQAALDAYELRAPFAGTVAEINVAAGQMIAPATWAVALVDGDPWFVETSDLTELDVVKLAVGQTAVVTADALPGVEMSGVVEEIAAAPKVQGGDILYTVRLRLTDPDARLLWGMTMEVTFTLEE